VGVTVLSLLIFVAVTLGLLAAPRLLGGRWSPAVWRGRRRLRREFHKDGQTVGALFKDPNALTLDPGPAPTATLGSKGAAAAARLGTSLRSRLQTALEQADLTLTVRQLLTFSGGLGLGLGVAGLFFGFLVGAGAAGVGAALPLLYVHFRRKARQEKILAQLPGAFGLMARVIRAGHSVPQALQAVADSFQGPLAAEFSKCQKQQSLGIRPEVTFHEMAQRTGLLEVRLFVSALLIQRQSGGNLSEVLERLANLVRDRLRLRKHVRTLTAEGRLQGLTLLILPVLVFGALLVVNRKYAQVLLDHPSLLGATAAAMGVGMLWIRKIVNFDF
jgi:tight adherence protein B